MKKILASLMCVFILACTPANLSSIEPYFFNYEVFPEKREIGSTVDFKLVDLKKGTYETFLLISKNESTQELGNRKVHIVEIEKFTIDRDNLPKQLKINLSGKFVDINKNQVELSSGDGVAIRVIMNDPKPKGLDVVLVD